MAEDSMNKFRVIPQVGKARAGVYNCAGGKFKVQTPAFLCPTARGVVPHLTGDNVARVGHGAGTFVAVEDFMDKIDDGDVPLMKTGLTGRQMMCMSDNEPFVLSTRRASPQYTQQPNADRKISIDTSEGVKMMPVDVYYRFAEQLQPDVLMAAPDLPGLSPGGLPGGNRSRKMSIRTERWLLEALSLKKDTPDVDLFAAILPGVPRITQRDYLEVLLANKDKVSGLSFWQHKDVKHPKKHIEPVLELVDQLELGHLPKFLTLNCNTPQHLLEMVTHGYDLFQGDISTEFTDVGVALDFAFPVRPGQSATRGRNMWDEQYVTQMERLSETVESSVKYFQAYINHLLKAREMSAWVILQMHNMAVMDQFFEGVRQSLRQGTFDEDVAAFVKLYGTHEDIMKQLDTFREENVGPTNRAQNSARF